MARIIIGRADEPQRRPAPSPRSRRRWREVGYLADEPAALVSFLAQRLGKPVLVEGPAGVGKTELAKALSRATGRELIRLQCYEGLDEAKALYEWNYRKQLLRIQAGRRRGRLGRRPRTTSSARSSCSTRPLMQAIASPEPVVLLIDEIDKTDQEFEAMLLELLSDFQITIPELGQIAATTMPIVVLTSNNSRELTEALKRRCLYLWLDYPERRARDGDRPPARARARRDAGPAAGRGRSRWSAALDLKKPPSIAESIDWARTLLLMGAEDIDRETFEQSMSIIVKHRTDIDLVAERVGVKLADAALDAARPEPAEPRPPPPGLAKLLGFCEELRSEGVAVGTSEILDAFAALEQVPWTSPRDFREALAATIAKSQEDRRVFELLFDRCFFRAAEAEAIERGHRARRSSASEGGERLDLDELREQIREAIAEGNDGEMRDLARLAIAAFGRQGEGSGRGRRRRAADPPHARPPGRAAAADEDGERAPPIDREQLSRFERHLRRELERGLIERTETLPPSRPLAELDRALPTSPTQDLAAVHRAVSQMKRRLATLGHEQRGRRRGADGRRAADDARLAGDRRRAAAAAATGRSARAGRRSTSSATSPPRSPRPASSSSPSCTRSTTRSASCAASSSSSGSPR